MSEKIEPVLTEEEWALGPGVADLHPVFDGAKIIAVANARLPESDPRKITREKIAAMRLVFDQWDGCGPGEYLGDREEYTSLERFLDALESYLPPSNSG
jgi:hypothetical protein